MAGANGAGRQLNRGAKVVILAAVILGLLLFIGQIRPIISPFLWALVAGYLLSPVVNYLHFEGRLPRVWAVSLIYALAGIALLGAGRYLYPHVVDDGTVFIEDIPRLEASLIALVGPRPLGIDIVAVVHQVLISGSGMTGSPGVAGHLLVNALETSIKTFLFLVATFYLLMDAPQLRRAMVRVIPPGYAPELTALGRQINVTWQQYIRGELLLFVIMASAVTIGLTALRVPGAIFLGLVSGGLELLPLVGPWTAGAVGVSVAYLSGTNPWGWSQLAYAGAVALLYLVLRQAEDYIVIPHVIGRAVRLHPLVVLLAVASGGVIGGLLGLVIAVPVAASFKEIGIYLYAKLLDRPWQPEPIRTIGGGIIEVPIHESATSAETAQPGGTRPVQP